jgi:hypothetical protein
MLLTGKGIEAYRLGHMLIAVKMEAQGFKNRRSIRRMLALELGLKGTAKHAEVIEVGNALLQRLIAEAHEAGDIQTI